MLSPIVFQFQDRTQARVLFPENPLYIRAHDITSSRIPSSLADSEDERQRLMKLHAVIRNSFDGLVHVPITLSGKDYILESATGTGAWVYDMANGIPSAEIIGIDVDSRLFPNPSTLPPNAKLQVQSILNMPTEWTKKYTLVQQRLSIATLLTTEWSQALKQIHRVLKPGGWVQLIEVDDWVAGSSMKIFHSLMIRLGESHGITSWPDVVPLLRKLLERCGFIDIRVTRRTTPTDRWIGGRDGANVRDNMMALFRGIRTPILEAGGYGVVSSGIVYDELLDRVEHEMDSIRGAEIRWVMIGARKPL